VWGIVAAVRAGDKFLGAVAVTVPAMEFDRLISVKMPAGSWSIVDGWGRLVYLNGVAEIPWEERDRSGDELVRRGLSGEEAINEHFAGPDGVARLGASVPIQPFGWVVEVSHRVTEVLAAARSRSLIEASKYGPALVIAILIAFVIAGRVGLPLPSHCRSRSGCPGSTKRRKLGGPVEVVQLTASFNTMAASLRRRQHGTRRSRPWGGPPSGLPLDEILSTGPRR
jgi:hypothetical protein